MKAISTGVDERMKIDEIIQKIFTYIFSDIIPVLAEHPIAVFIFLLVLLIVVKRGKEYVNNSYFQITKNQLEDVAEDSGTLGEYLIYKKLKKFEKHGAKFLFNVYIPKGDGGTTEIDILMICHQGLVVFESKNYGGWIYGNEFQPNWCQIFPTGDWKEHHEYFYNPVMQNRTHIRHLKKIVGNRIHTYSVVVFSEKCTLKNIEIESDNVYVTKCDDVKDVVARICNDFSHKLLNKKERNEIYEKLYPYSQADKKTKKKHAKRVKRIAWWHRFWW